MVPISINGFWTASDTRIGPWSVATQQPSQEQIDNANIVRSFFVAQGWTMEAICGMIGCMMGESTINPGFVQETHRNLLPNNGADIYLLTNAVMMDFYGEFYQDLRRGYAIGLVQWDGYSNRGGVQGQKLVNYCRDNNIDWYDGWSQLYRLNGEWQYDVTHQSHSFMYKVRVGGIDWDFNNYPQCTLSVEDCAYIWTTGYERNKGGLGDRGLNGRWYYDFFLTDPDAPAIIPPERFNRPLPYNPDLPPFDPVNPQPVTPPGADYLPDWLYAYIITQRKRGGKKWTRT